MAEETIFNEWTNVVAQGRNDLVFEHKNKEYGAYALRKTYNRTVTVSLTIAAVVFVVLVSIPAILDWLNKQKEEEVAKVDITAVDLTAPPPIDETEPPPPPPPPPPVMETVKFTPPVVEDDVVEEDPPPVQTEETPQISTVTQEGDGNNQEIIIPETGTGVVEPVKEEIFTIVEQMPEFPGGTAAMMKWIKDKIEAIGYPQMEKEAGISGTCYVTFVVDKEGTVTDSKIMRGVSGGPGYDKVALQVVKAMPKWSSGKQNGRAVSVQYNLPIKFTIR